LASPPFNINEAIPGDTDLVSAHPSGARTFRDVTESWISVEHDTYGHHTFPHDDGTARDAQDNTNEGNIWFNTDTDPATVELFDGSDWVGVRVAEAATADTATSASAVAAGSIAAASLGADVFDGLDSVTPATGDLVPLGDVSDSGDPKNATIEDILALATPVAEKFTSTDQTITSGGSLTIAHGLSGVPQGLIAELICQSDEVGYTAGDVLQLNPHTNDLVTAVARGFACVKDATNLNIRYGNNANVFNIFNFSDGSLQVATNGHWKLRLTAIYYA
jgi:hypothetical protein